MTARVCFAVLLCLSGCLSSTEAALGRNTVKPGVCPNTKYEAEECAWIRFVSCANDSDCAKMEKCCNNGCGLQCMAPVTVTVKPGVCPYIKYVCAVEAEDKCADDSECPKKEKCCGTACSGRQCTAPVTVKPGVCPNTKYEAEECALIRFVSCADDSDCAKTEKCCSNGCGLQCMAPVIAKPGVCPITNNGTIMCVRQDDELCASDSECPDNQKCCSTVCNGLDCMTPVKAVKPGVCPRRKYKVAMCPRIRFVSCADDSDCAKTEKCCSNGCGRQCMAPVTAKPGVCPVTKRIPMCPLMLLVSCADDSDCADNKKCCNTTCGGRGCMAPVIEVLPY